MREKVDLDQLMKKLQERGWSRRITEGSCRLIASCGFQSKNLMLAIVATDILASENPMTLRGLFYRVVSAGWLPSTDDKHYRLLGRVMTILREARVVPFRWVVDGIRSTIKPSSWSGLMDFAETTKEAYRKNFWSGLDDYVHIFCEKDAMSGAIAPVTEKYDVSLSVLRGFSSVSYVHEIASRWRNIEKPIFAFYLGDCDPSGMELERDMQEKLRKYSERFFFWRRLAVTQEDFSEFNLFPLELKMRDPRAKRFLDQGYTQCAELDAIPAQVLRDRIEQEILLHIPSDQWQKLQHIEELERNQWYDMLKTLKTNANQQAIGA